MFKKVLVANRGEIAIRIIKSLHNLNIKTVSIYSTTDKNSSHVKLSDESICIGKGSSKDSYLNIENIMCAAILSGCDAIHPGSGFLSENYLLSKNCEDCNIQFIGPSSKVLQEMGNKVIARKIAVKCNIPIIPGSIDYIKNITEAKNQIDNIGVPILLKSAQGGGGKGIRLLQKLSQINKVFPETIRESQTSFGNNKLYLEKLINDAKHIEIQVMCDKFGNVICYPERDCSVQLNHQKIIEETPSSIISDEIRSKLCSYSRSICKYIGYVGAGTVEFLVRDEKIYFIEMNSRIQVEHPITEMVTHTDLIEQQIEVFSHSKHLEDCNITPDGFSLECRINAVDVYNKFIPSCGKINYVHFPIGGYGVRIDTGFYFGDIVSPYYDSMLTKIIVYSDTRKKALIKMHNALLEFQLEGVETNKDFLDFIVCNSVFIKDFIKNNSLENYIIKEWKDSIVEK